MSKKTKIEKRKQKPKSFIIPKVFMSIDTIEKIRSEALLYGGFETGGLLIGEKTVMDDSYAIVVKQATGPGNNSEHGTHYFKPDNKYYKKVLWQQLHRNGIVYVGEWHKHPGSFDEPSCTDLDTMKKITEDENSKDILAIIATTVDSKKQQPLHNSVKIDFFYYQRGMSNFIEIKPEIIKMPPLKSSPLKVEKINLDVEKIAELIQNDEQLMLEGFLTDNNILNIINGQNVMNPYCVDIVFSNNDKDISMNTSTNNLLIVINIEKKKFLATGWQLDEETGEYNKIDVDLIDFKDQLFKRLGGLGVKENLFDKKVGILGLGSVGSVVAAQLTKAGVKNLSIIDSDTLETHNIIRHLCDIRDLGRYKTDAVKDKLLGINNDMEVECFQNDFIKDYEKIEKNIKELDLLVVSTDTPDSRQLANITSVKFGIPAIYISLHERARTGKVMRIVPGITGCRHCVGNGRWGGEFSPGVTDYTETADFREIFFQPGLDADINMVTMLGVRMAISSLLHPSETIIPELNTNFIMWNGYPDENQPLITVGDGIGLPKNQNCEICGIQNSKMEKS